VSSRQSNQALSRVAIAVAKDRDDARDALARRLPVSDLRRVARKLSRVADALADSDAAAGRSPSSRSWEWTIDARVAARAARLTTAIREAGAVYLPERLHAVRINVKKLRYAVELRADLRAEKPGADLRLLRHAQDSLGRMHDIQVLIDRVRRVQASLTPPSITVWRALDELTIALDAECRELHGRYMRRRTDLLELAERLSAKAQPPRKRTVIRQAAG
jgi:CHAD domain-containing protein